MDSLITSVQKYIVRANKGRPRIWIEGARLVSAGFTPGVRFTIERHGDHIRIRAGDNGNRKVSGKGDKPIIDLSGKGCAPFDTGDAVTVTYFKTGTIVIQRA